MTAFLIVLTALVLLILLILLIDVSLIFVLDDRVRVRVKVLFFSFEALTLVEKLAKSQEGKAVEQTAVKEKKKKRLRTPDEIAEIIGYFTRLVKAVITEFRRWVRLKICHVSVRVATDDAARTAQLYGVVSGAVWGLVALFDNTMKIKKQDKKINVFPDFTTEESSVKLKLVIKLKIIHALLAVMHLLPLFMNRKAGIRK